MRKEDGTHFWINIVYIKYVQKYTSEFENIILNFNRVVLHHWSGTEPLDLCLFKQVTCKNLF